jgi:hypothetical protein
MTQGKAIATVSGRTIAETDEYEVVEGNVYVCSSLIDPYHLLVLIDISSHLRKS